MLCRNMKTFSKSKKTIIKKIVSHEYVIFNSSQCQTVEEYDENWEGLWVAPYPERVAYDDWYERSMGSSLLHGWHLPADEINR
jgi:hypothetical protein